MTLSGVWDAEGMWVIHKSIWNAWPGFSTPHPEAPSVGPMGQLLASLTLLQSKLLRHDAPVIILPLPAQSGFYPSASLPDFLHAWIPSLATQLWTDISSLHSKPTRTRPLQRKHLEDNTHLSSSVHLRACEWSTQKCRVCAENMGFCYKLVIEKRRRLFWALHLSRYNVNILWHCIRLCTH